MQVAQGRSDASVSAVWRLLLRILLAVGIVYACYRLRSIITTLFIASIIAYVLDPSVEWLCRNRHFVAIHYGIARVSFSLKSLPKRKSSNLAESTSPFRMRRHGLRSSATLYMFVISILVLWKGTALIITPFVAEIKTATSDAGREQLMKNKQDLIDKYDNFVPDWARSQKIEEQIKKTDISKTAQAILGDVGKQILENLKNVVEVVLLPVLAFYFLIDGKTLKHEFVSLIPRKRIKETLRILREFNQIMRAFVLAQFILCTLAGVVVGLWLAHLHVPYPFILGVLAGVTRAIPIIGPIIGGIPIILLAWASSSFTTGLQVLAFFTLMHFAESKFIMPVLIGDSMELHPVVIIVVLIVGGEIGGILIGGQLGALLGMFFAAPLASIARVIIRRYWLQLKHDRINPPPSSNGNLHSPVENGYISGPIV